jgi:phage-related baseplate assembly protein
LDHRAAEYDVVRLPGETDERLRTRTWLTIAGRSPGGTEERYKAIALGVSLDVAETEIYRNGLGPQLEMAVLATNNNGVPDQALLDAVSDAVNVKKVALVGDTIRVVSAVKVEVNVTLDVWLLPTGDAALLDRLPGVILEAWAAESGIGFDLNPGWLTARALLAGVSRVVPTNPTEPIVAAKHEAISIQSVTIKDRGRQR